LKESHRKYGGDLYNFRLTHNLQISTHLNETKVLRTQINTVKPDKNIMQSYFVWSKITGASILNDEGSFNLFLQEMKNVDLSSDVLEGNKVFLLSMMFQSNIFQEEEKKKVKKAILEIINKSEHKKLLMTWFHNFLVLIEGKEPTLDFDNLNQLPDFIKVSNLRWAIQNLFKKGNIQDIPLYIEKLEPFTIPHSGTSAHLLAGHANYTLGLINSYMGNKMKAIEYLKKARNLGMATNMSFFEYDINFKPLYNIPEFQEINKPRWPEIMN